MTAEPYMADLKGRSFRPILGLALCYPSEWINPCGSCLRYRRGDAPEAERRVSPVIDATAIGVVKENNCPMWALPVSQTKP